MRWSLCLSFFGAFTGLAAAGGLSTVQNTPRVYQEAFQVRRGGGFRLESWTAMAPEAAQIIVESGCRALGFSCSDDPADKDQNTRYIKPGIASGDYQGTARIVRLRGDKYYAKFVAPRGYTTCRAGVYLRRGLISEGATFSGSIQRSGLDGLSVYADLGDDASGPGWIEFQLLVQYVASETAERWKCWPDQTIILLCRGPADCRASRAYPETDLR